MVNRRGKSGSSDRFLFSWAPKSWVHDCMGDCNHEINRCLLLGRKTVTNLVTILRSRNITSPTNVRIVKAMVFFSSHVWIWELDPKEGWVLKNWCFWIVMLEKTLERTLDCKDIKPVNSKGNKPWIFFGRTLELKLQPFGHLIRRADSCKRSWYWGKLKAKVEGGDNEMVR